MGERFVPLAGVGMGTALHLDTTIALSVVMSADGDRFYPALYDVGTGRTHKLGVVSYAKREDAAIHLPPYHAHAEDIRDVRRGVNNETAKGYVAGALLGLAVVAVAEFALDVGEHGWLLAWAATTCCIGNLIFARR